MKQIINKIEETEEKISNLEDRLYEEENENEIKVLERKIEVQNDILEKLQEDLELFEDVDIEADEDYKIAVEDWGLYNEGILCCKWWDSNASYEEIETYYKLKRKYLASSCDPDEVELFIADYETPFKCSEHDNIEDILDRLNELYALDDDDITKLTFLMEHQGLDFDEALHNYDDVVIYENSTMEDIAIEFVDSCYNLEDMMGSLSRYFDYEALGRDMEIEGNFTNINGDIYEYRR